MEEMSKSRERSIWFHILDVVFNVVIIVAFVGGIRTFLVSPFQVEGNSMVHTLEDNEYIIINKLTYYVGSPKRGDVVVFRPPEEHKKYYVKRIIGTPGDTVVLRDGYVHLKRTEGDKTAKLDEEGYLSDSSLGKTYRHPPGSGDTSEISYVVPDDHFFLLGDNRQGSLDSRSFTAQGSEPSPYVPEDNIKGRVWFVALPITKIHALEPPDYEFTGGEEEL
jgi:signal peptidase I